MINLKGELFNPKGVYSRGIKGFLMRSYDLSCKQLKKSYFKRAVDKGSELQRVASIDYA